MSTPADEYDEKFVKPGREQYSLSLTEEQIKEFFGCSNACAKLAKHIAEERRRKEEREREERKEEREQRRQEREYQLRLAELRAGIFCIPKFVSVCNHFHVHASLR